MIPGLPEIVLHPAARWIKIDILELNFHYLSYLNIGPVFSLKKIFKRKDSLYLAPFFSRKKAQELPLPQPLFQSTDYTDFSDLSFCLGLVVRSWTLNVRCSMFIFSPLPRLQLLAAKKRKIHKSPLSLPPIFSPRIFTPR